MEDVDILVVADSGSSVMIGIVATGWSITDGGGPSVVMLVSGTSEVVDVIGSGPSVILLLLSSYFITLGRKVCSFLLLYVTNQA